MIFIVCLFIFSSILPILQCVCRDPNYSFYTKKGQLVQNRGEIAQLTVIGLLTMLYYAILPNF